MKFNVLSAWLLLLISMFFASFAFAANKLPTAKAGADQVLNEQVLVTLNGSQSLDKDGTIAAYNWLQTAGKPLVTLVGADTASPTFTAPTLTKVAKLTFKLTVTDNVGGKASDTVVITVKPVNAKPVANAGLDRIFGKALAVKLNGKLSIDSDGSITKFAWKQTAGPAVKLKAANTAEPTFTTPSKVTKPLTLVFKLTVTDNENATATDTVTVTIKTSNAPPTANAGSDQSLNEKTLVTLSSTGSQDSDGDIDAYSWQQTAGASVVLANANTATATFTAPDVPSNSDLVFQLTVTDNDGATASDTVTINVKNVNVLPIANAGADQNVDEKSAVTLNGTASKDDDGTLSSYLWEQTSGTAVTLAAANTATATFTAPELNTAAVLVFKLTVTDNDGATAIDTITVNVRNVNALPVANAGSDQSVDEKTTTSLDGGLSSDPDGTLSSFLWEQTAGPSVVFSTPQLATTQFNAPDVAEDTQLVFKLTVTDNEGSTHSDTVAVTVKPSLDIKITTPATLTTIGSTPQTVKGTVSDASAQITVNGAEVTNNNGTFEAAVNLDEGHNTITARATDTKGHDVSDVISLSLDMTPPYITVESPKAGDTVRVDKIAVSGLVNDIVRGTVAEGQAQVSVNGVAATISNRSFLAENIALVAGENTLTINAVDNVGNTSTLNLKITYQPTAGQRLELIGGQDQSAKINTALAQPLSVKLVDDKGQAVANKPVIFRVTEGDGVVGAGSADEGQGTLVQTDAQGTAATTFKLGSRAGNGNQRVRAASVGFDGEILFYASATVGVGNKVTVNSGNNQRGATNQPLPQPFVVAVVDDGANVVAGAKIEFKVTQGGGRFQNNETRIISTTDSDGRATAEFTVGPEEGLDVHRVTATLVDTALYAGFTASALKTGDAGQTSISGVVLDNQDHPLPKVTVRVDGTTREAQTDAQGQFKITEAPVGSVHLIADGSTSTAEGEWPTLAFNLVTVAGADNPLSAPIYLVKLDTINAKTVGDKDVTLTLPEVPGFALEVKAGSVTFPDGKKIGKLSVTPVNASKIPMSPPNGMQPQFIVTIQPVGAKFDPPARLSLPNVDGHKPGAQVEMYSYDHDLEEFVAIGLGTVNAEGSVIKSNDGVGVIKAGWHCGSQPGGSGCASSAGECQKCEGNCQIVPDPSKTPKDSTAAGDCKKTICTASGGTSTGPNDGDKPTGDANRCKDCSSGSIVNKPDGTKLNECEKCKSGAVEKEPDEVQSTSEFSWSGLQTLLSDINAILDFLGAETKLPVVGIKFSVEDKKVCCVQKGGAKTSEKTEQGTVTVPWKSGEWTPTIPPWSGDYTIPLLGRDIGIKYGVRFSGAINFNANLSRATRECQNDKCWGGSIGADGSVDGGLFGEVPNPALPPECGPNKDRTCSAVRLTGKGVVGVNLQGSVNCEQFEGKLGHAGFTAVGEFALAEGTYFEVAASKSIPLLQPATIWSGSIALPN